MAAHTTRGGDSLLPTQWSLVRTRSPPHARLNCSKRGRLKTRVRVPSLSGTSGCQLAAKLEVVCLSSKAGPRNHEVAEIKGVDDHRPLWCLRPTMKFFDRSVRGGRHPSDGLSGTRSRFCARFRD